MPVLDTGFAIDFLRGDERATRLMHLLQQGSDPLGVTPYTHFELYSGIGRSHRPDEETRKVEGFLRSLVVFPFEPEAAKHAGLLDARLQREGASIGLLDLLIGCTALHHGESVVTRNKRDFEAIPGLRVLAY